VLGEADWAPKGRRRVLYVAGEDSAGVAMRLRALRHHLGLRVAGQVHLYPRAADLTDEREVSRLAAYLLAERFDWVVVDTFRQSTLGVNENDNTEVGLVLGRLLALRDDHGVSAILVDHTNKSAQGLADLGGAGAKRANTDFVLMIDLPNGDRSPDQQRTLRVAKLKNKRDGATWPIRLETIREVVDAEGDPSAVVLVGEADGASAPDIHGTDDWRQVVLPPDVLDFDGKGRQDLATVTQLVIHYGSEQSGISRGELLRHFRAAVGEGVSADASLKRVTRAWDALHALGRLEPVGNGTSGIAHHRWSQTPILAP
jgi:hypothetical protein